MSTFKKGDSVAIINQTLGGRFVVEGKAKIHKILRDDPEAFIVDPAAQADPEAFVAQLNALRMSSVG